MENRIDWKRKLTSRKLWIAVCSLATNLIIAFGGTQETAVQVTAIIMAGATCAAYIIGEGLVDAASVDEFDYAYDIEEKAPPNEE